MVVYNADDSDNLMEALKANLAGAKEIFQRASRGSKHLVQTIDSGTLSGAAYKAGKQIFVSYVDPLVQKLSLAVEDIENDLGAYRSADAEIRQVDTHIDGERVRQQRDATNRLIDSLQGRISTERQTLRSLIESPYGMGSAPNTGNLADSLNNLNRQLDKLQKLKADYDQELAALQAFVDDTAPLFKDSSQTFKDAMRGVAAINSSRASIDGSIAFPKGTDMKWAKSLKNDKLDSGLDPNTLPVSYRVKVTQIQNDTTLSAQQKADKIEKVYEDWLYSLDPKGFTEYAAARKKYNKAKEKYEKDNPGKKYHFVSEDPDMIAADKKLSKSLHNTHVNIRTVSQSLGDDVAKISDTKSYTQFYGMVQTDHPLDLKNRTHGDDTYSIWSRGWDGNPKEKNG